MEKHALLPGYKVFFVLNLWSTQSSTYWKLTWTVCNHYFWKISTHGKTINLFLPVIGAWGFIDCFRFLFNWFRIKIWNRDCFCCLPCDHIVAIGQWHGLLKTFWPIVIGCALRTAGISSITWNFAYALNTQLG